MKHLKTKKYIDSQLFKNYFVARNKYTKNIYINHYIDSVQHLFMGLVKKVMKYKHVYYYTDTKKQPDKLFLEETIDLNLYLSRFDIIFESDSLEECLKFVETL